MSGGNKWSTGNRSGPQRRVEREIQTSIVQPPEII